MTIHLHASARRGVEVVGAKGVFASDGRHLRFWQKTDAAGTGGFSGMKEVFGLAPEISPQETVRSPEGWLEPDERIRDTVQSIVDALDNDVRTALQRARSAGRVRDSSGAA